MEKTSKNPNEVKVIPALDQSLQWKSLRHFNSIRFIEVSFCLLFLCCLVNPSVTAQALDSASATRIINKPIVTAIDNQAKLIQESIANRKPVNVKRIELSETTANIITFLPIAFFFFILVSVLIKLKKDRVKLSDILVDKDTLVEIKKEETAVAVADARAREAAANAIRVNPQAISNDALRLIADTPNPAEPSQNAQQPEQSVSRLVAFICGITSVGLASCITTYYFYRSFTEGGEIPLTNLATILYGLGIGVIPYGFNKIANAIKN